MNMESTWVPVKSKAKGTVGYMEKFMTGCGTLVSLPGISRWIDGPILDISKAVVID